VTNSYWPDRKWGEKKR